MKFSTCVDELSELLWVFFGYTDMSSILCLDHWCDLINANGSWKVLHIFVLMSFTVHYDQHWTILWQYVSDTR